MKITRSSRRTIAGKRPLAITTWILLPLGAALLSSCSQPSGNSSPTPAAATASASATSPSATASATKPPAMAAASKAAPTSKPAALVLKPSTGGPITAKLQKLTAMPSPEPLLPASSRYVPADEKSAGFRLSYALASYTHTGQTLELHLERLKGAAPLNNFSWQVGSPVTEKWPGGKVAEVKVSKFDSKPDGTDRAIISVQVQVTLSAKPQSVSYFVPVIGNGAKITVQVNSLN